MERNEDPADNRRDGMVDTSTTEINIERESRGKKRYHRRVSKFMAKYEIKTI